MEELMIIIELFTGISVLVILADAYTKRKKGIIERLTRSGKISLYISLAFIIGYMAYRTFQSDGLSIKVLRFMSEGIQISLVYYCIVFYLSYFGLIQNWMVETINVEE